MPPKHEEVIGEDNSAFFFKVPKQWFWRLVIIFCLGWNPGRDVVTSILPQRGSKERGIYNKQNLADNQEIISGLEEGRVANSNNIYLLSQGLTMHIQHQKEFQDSIMTQFSEVKTQIKDVNQRLDRVILK